MGGTIPEKADLGCRRKAVEYWDVTVYAYNPSTLTVLGYEERPCIRKERKAGSSL